MKYHDNDVVIVNSGNCVFDKEGTFEIKECCVTDGQDPEGKLAAGIKFTVGTDGKITFSLGRKKSTEVAEWWIDRVPSEKNTYQKKPKELNFAMIGTLTLHLKNGIFGNSPVTLVLEDIAFAQGNDGTRNNWWFGGVNCSCAVDRGVCLDSQQVTVLGEVDDKRSVRIVAYRSETGISVNTVTFEYRIINLLNAGWMAKKFKDDTKLKDMVLPASHDAGMSELHHLHILAQATPKAVQTQDAWIEEQLLYGCRYFDIRIDYDHEQLVTYHRTGPLGANGQSIMDVMEQAVRFLKKYPSETFILKFSHIRDYQGHKPKETIAQLHKYLGNFKGYFFKSDMDVCIHELTYAELKGKILVVCDYDSNINPKEGYFRYRDIGGRSNKVVNEYRVYDKYSNESNYEKMSQDQLEKWKEANGRIAGGSYELFLLSWTLTQTIGSIKDGAKIANGNLKGVLEEKSDYAKPHLIYVDFIDFEVCNTIINCN